MHPKTPDIHMCVWTCVHILSPPTEGPLAGTRLGKITGWFYLFPEALSDSVRPKETSSLPCASQSQIWPGI
jgi:hypothetical protein